MSMRDLIDTVRQNLTEGEWIDDNTYRSKFQIRVGRLIAGKAKAHLEKLGVLLDVDIKIAEDKDFLYVLFTVAVTGNVRKVARFMESVQDMERAMNPDNLQRSNRD